MADFQEQAMGITGLTIDGSSTSPSRTEFSQFLNDGVLDVTNRVARLRPQDRDDFSRVSDEQTANASLDLGGADVISVVREDGVISNNWRPCRKISLSLQHLVTDVDSLHFSSKFYPSYMVGDNGQVSVFPIPGSDPDAFKVYYVNNVPQDKSGAVLIYSHSDIKYFVDDKVYLVVLYASIQALMAKMTSLNSALPSDITLPSLPITPSMNTTTVSIPSFTAPDAFVQPVAPAGADIDFSSVPTAPSYVSQVSPTLTDTTVTETSITEPSFTSPVMSAPDFSDTNTWITTEEDPEMLAARVQEIQAKIGEYSARIGEAQAKFNKDNAIFQKDIQIAIQNAQIEAAEDGTKLQKYGSDVQNETARVDNDMKIYQQEITKAAQTYQAETGYDLGKYNGEVQSAAAKFTNDLQKNNTTFQGDLAKFSTDLKETQQENQEKIALYGADVQKYSAELAGKAQEFTTSLQKDQADYQWTTAQYASLKAQYNEAFIVMAPPAPPQQPQQRVAQRRR